MNIPFRTLILCTLMGLYFIGCGSHKGNKSLNGQTGSTEDKLQQLPLEKQCEIVRDSLVQLVSKDCPAPLVSQVLNEKHEGSSIEDFLMFLKEENDDHKTAFAIAASKGQLENIKVLRPYASIDRISFLYPAMAAAVEQQQKQVVLHLADMDMVSFFMMIANKKYLSLLSQTADYYPIQVDSYYNKTTLHELAGAAISTIMADKETLGLYNKILDGFFSRVDFKILTQTSYSSLLESAVRSANFPFVKKLLQYDPQLDSYSAQDTACPLAYAIAKNHKYIYRFLLEHGPEKVLSCGGEYPLLVAIKNNAIDFVELYVAKNFNVNITAKNQTTGKWQTPYDVALQSPFVSAEMVQLLRDHGAKSWKEIQP